MMKPHTTDTESPASKADRIPKAVCVVCGKPCGVYQVPAPVPFSDAYCADNPDCVAKCREMYSL
jgi:hypothetical protein